MSRPLSADKAIDLLDEACASIRTEMDSMPAELDEITRRVTRLQIEETALKKEKDAASKTRLDELRKELADLKAQADAMTARWQAEKKVLDETRVLREQLEAARTAYEKAERAYDNNRAAELKYGTIPDLEKKLKAAQPGSSPKTGASCCARRSPRRDRRGVFALGRHSVRSCSKASARSSCTCRTSCTSCGRTGRGGRSRIGRCVAFESGHQNRQRPVGAFLFWDPGRGQNRIAKTLAAELFDDEAAMVRIDMSEYMGKHTVCVWSERLRATSATKGRPAHRGRAPQPYSVVLLDEIEKAHPDVFNILLQVLDDGRLTDSHGRTVSFRNAVIIMTCTSDRISARSRGRQPSALARQRQEKAETDPEISEAVRRQVMDLLKTHFVRNF
jgi:ATP-dependent Clp protease ATP-binding subunit ClpB